MDKDTSKRPFWMPDTQGFLALAIILVVSALAFMLLNLHPNLDDKVAGAFMTLLGVLTACLKDVYGFFFGSSRGSEKKDDAMIERAVVAPPPPPSPVSTTTTTTDDKTVTRTEPAAPAPPVDPAHVATPAAPANP